MKLAKGSSGFSNMSKAEREKTTINDRLQSLIDHEGNASGYNYRIQTSDWEKYGKSRTYFKIIETRDNSKRRAEYDYGYYDNKEEKYVAGKSDIFKNYSLRGSSFDIEAEIKKRKRKKK